MPKKIKPTEEQVEQVPQKNGEEQAMFNQEGQLVVDVFENNEEFVVLAAIAGVQIKDLDISVEKELMVIKGDRQSPHETDNKFFFQECYWGPFSRKIVLPENIDTTAAKAEMNKGMLTVRIPKMAPGDGNGKVEVS